MIKSFKIKNFRCFKEMSLKDLSTINIIVGDNGTGKTALLEAILLVAHAHPRSVMMMRTIRNHPLPQTQIPWDRLVFKSIWEDLFFNFSDSDIISAEFEDSFRGRFAVGVSYVYPEKSPTFSLIDPIPELAFVRSGADGSKASARIKINDEGKAITEGLAEIVPYVYILPSSSFFFHEDMVGLFSAMSKENNEEVIINAMQQDFPQISDIEILVDTSGPGLYVETKSAVGKKQPLGTVSSGAARYLNMLLAIAARKKGVVLIDEIENGIYWQKMPNIWKRLKDLCQECEVQVFATTHSNECLQSLIETMEEHQEDFSLIRTEIVDGQHCIDQFSGRPFLAALKGRGEIR